MVDPDELLEKLNEHETGSKTIGVGKLAEALGLEPGRRWGKWCSACEGIWFGWIYEVECPQCGNRHG